MAKSLRYIARRLAMDLLNNMQDRRGFKTDSVDAQVMRRWLDEWTFKIEEVLKAGAAQPGDDKPEGAG